MFPRKAIRLIGIFINHQEAHFFAPENGPQQEANIESGIERQLRFPGETGNGVYLGNFRSTNNEHHRHNREAEIMKRYFKALSLRLKEYDAIVVLGPKILLHRFQNHLRADKSFDSKKCLFKQHDKMTETEFQLAVKDYKRELLGELL